MPKQLSFLHRSENFRLRRISAALLLVAGTGLGAGCAAPAGPASSAPADPFARLRNYTAVSAYESGTCVTDADCVLQGCDTAVCAPPGDVGTCMSSPVGACLAQLPAETCGCNDGVCHWARTREVNLCAQLDWQKPMNRTNQRDHEGIFYAPRLAP